MSLLRRDVKKMKPVPRLSVPSSEREHLFLLFGYQAKRLVLSFGAKTEVGQLTNKKQQ